MSRVPLTDERKLDILELVEKGVPHRQIAKDLHCSTTTVRKVRDEFYGGGPMAETIIAGNKYDGQLVSVSSDRYSGTCRGQNGRMKKKTFKCASSKEAIRRWEEWKRKEAAPKTPVTVTRIDANIQKEKTVSNNSEDILDNAPVIFVL